MLCTLFHEIMFFFIPFFCLLEFGITGQLNYKKVFPLFLAAFVPIVILFFFRSPINGGQTHLLLAERGVKLGKGILEYPDEMSYITGAMLMHLGLYAKYSVYFIFMILIFCHYALTHHKEIISTRFSFILPISILFMLPLCVLAWDWGRWIAAFFTLVLVLLAGNLSEKKSDSRKYQLDHLLYLTFTIGYMVNIKVDVYHHLGSDGGFRATVINLAESYFKIFQLVFF